jgi:hypothetical protein
LQPNDHDDGDKENMLYGDQLTKQASNRQDENMKQLENYENTPQKVQKLMLVMWYPSVLGRICGI